MSDMISADVQKLIDEQPGMTHEVFRWAAVQWARDVQKNVVKRAANSTHYKASTAILAIDEALKERWGDQ